MTQYGSTGLPWVVQHYSHEISFSFNLNLSSKDIKVENM